MAGKVGIKRIYDPATDTDGQRVLVDRIWPRGVRRDAAKVDVWLKAIAPTSDLRQWFGHDPARWAEFRQRYRQELRDNEAAIEELCSLVARGHVTLLYAARDKQHNNALVLADYLRERCDR